MSNKILPDELMEIIKGRIVAEVPLGHGYMVKVDHHKERCGVGCCMCKPHITVKVLSRLVPANIGSGFGC